MKTKLEMAHDYVMNYLSNPSCENATVSSIVSVAWSYADAMQAEADKRENKEPRETHKNLAEFKMHPEYDAGINYPPDAWVMYRGEKRLAVSIKEEWQPDWSQAPEWYNWWAMDEDRKCHWFSKEPNLVDGFSEWILGNNGEGLNNTYSPSINCGYTGDWRDSLRKRPN